MSLSPVNRAHLWAWLTVPHHSRCARRAAPDGVLLHTYKTGPRPPPAPRSPYPWWPNRGSAG